MKIKPTIQCPCSGEHLATVFSYDKPPKGETVFNFGAQKYDRGYSRCGFCKHWFSDNHMDISDLYDGAYVDNTYSVGMFKSFERILALPEELSDNTGRVACVLSFARKHFGAQKRPRLLDVGAGLGVFPYRMKEAGWICSALDPDERATRHATEVIDIAAFTGDFMKIDPLSLGRFDVVTFNKVLEHVEDPVAMLQRALSVLAPGGFVYFEVPDGETARAEGPEREEFFIEHHHVFSLASAVLVATRAGFSPAYTERLREPSRKFTLRVFSVASPS